MMLNSPSAEKADGWRARRNRTEYGASDIDGSCRARTPECFPQIRVSIRADVKNISPPSLRVGAGGDPNGRRRVADLQGAPVEGNGIRHQRYPRPPNVPPSISIRRWVQGATIEICHGRSWQVAHSLPTTVIMALAIDRHGAELFASAAINTCRNR